MFEKFPMSRPGSPPSKETILRQADALRAEARRTRRLRAGITDEADRQSLARHITELEANAARLEKTAIEAKSR